MKAIYFDMDGTIANLYGVNNWLEMLLNSDDTPYKVAKPLLQLNILARYLNKLQSQGYHIGIVSWLCKGGNTEYNKQVTDTKIKWLKTHLKSVKWNEIKIVEYGIPKEKIVNYPKGILFDDELKNRRNWKGKAYDESQIMEILRAIA